MAKRILIIGSTGMLGHVVFKHLQKNPNLELHDLTFRTKLRPTSVICDVRNFPDLLLQIKSVKPDVVVNCVGVLVQGSKSSPVDAITLNSLLPQYLHSISQECNFRLIHISTDCVFSGKTGQYTESSFRDADDTYGRTKALGEVASETTLTIRTSIVGPELKVDGVGLLHWFLTNTNEAIHGYSNVFWGGVTTLECAKAIEFAISRSVTGLWHLTNSKEISKYDMLIKFNNLIQPAKRRDVLLQEQKVSNKSLRTERSDIDYHVPEYEGMFNAMGEDIKDRISDYPYYADIQ